MTFISLEFVLFFTVIAFIYYLIPHRFQLLLLLTSSYIFCASWSIQFTLVLALSTIGNFFSGKAIYDARVDPRRRFYLFSNIAFNLLLLFVFKYFNFFSDSLAAALSALHIANGLTVAAGLLPIGISYYTFQELSYILDIYHGKIKAENNLGTYATYVSFFPQLPSGPIGRATSLLPQFHQRLTFDADRTVEGLQLILWGVFKKVVIADHLGIYVNQIYDQPQGKAGWSLIIATLFFAFQIYCDFSGYSDIAIGIARLLGFKLMNNFRQPYLSQSFQEFWTRWHISLSTWIRDYLFIPFSRTALKISQGRFTQAIQLLAYLIVMGLVGLWHGANWTFIVWGIIHGIFLGLEGLFRRHPGTLRNLRINSQVIYLFKTATTFLLICWTWIFFRANTLSDAWYITTHLPAISLHPLRELISAFGPDATRELPIVVLLIMIIVGVDILAKYWEINDLLNRIPTWSRWAIYYILVGSILGLGLWGKPDFIYFKF